jgi:hypothetical protein
MTQKLQDLFEQTVMAHKFCIKLKGNDPLPKLRNMSTHKLQFYILISQLYKQTHGRY